VQVPYKVEAHLAAGEAAALAVVGIGDGLWVRRKRWYALLPPPASSPPSSSCSVPTLSPAPPLPAAELLMPLLLLGAEAEAEATEVNDTSPSPPGDPTYPLNASAAADVAAATSGACSAAAAMAAARAGPAELLGPRAASNIAARSGRVDGATPWGHVAAMAAAAGTIGVAPTIGSAVVVDDVR